MNMVHSDLPAESKPFARLDLWLALAGFLFALTLYGRTLATDVLLGDSAEFQVLAATGGLAHPTGYPIYLIIAKLFTWIPIGGLAMRVSLLSAVMGALVVGEVFLLARTLGARRVYAGAVAILLAITPLFWWQSILAEVYTVSAAFFAGFLLCALVWRQTRNPVWLAAGGALGGLCWGLHHTAVLTLPAVLLFLAVTKAVKKDWGSAAVGAAAGLAISMAAYMVTGSVDDATTATNSLRPSASAYGMKAEDFDSPVTRVMFVMNAKQWQSELAKEDPERLSKNWTKYTAETTSGLGWPVLLLFAGGSVLLFVRRWRDGVLLVGAWLILFAYILTFHAFDIEVNYLLGYVVMLPVAAFGLQALQDLVSKQPLAMPLRFASAVAAWALIFVGVGPVISGAWSALQEGKAMFLPPERRQLPYPVDYPAGPHDYGRAMVANIAPNGLLITKWEFVYPCYYVARFEANKPEIEIIEANPTGTGGVLSESMREFLRQSVTKRPIYATGILGSLRDTYDFQEVIPGQLYRMVPR